MLGSVLGCGTGTSITPGRPSTQTDGQLQEAEPVAGHPRLWIRPEDLPRLRGLAIQDNPYYREGLAVLVEAAEKNMDEGRVPDQDSGSAGWEEYPTEDYALLFAFMSLVHPEQAARAGYAARARSLLMHAMDRAVKGPAQGQPFQEPSFSWNDRSRWYGRSWGLTVDWIYPYLSASDKSTIRKVFTRWCEEIRTQGRYHPEPVGTRNDPRMLSDPEIYRWSANNYFTAGMRNMGYMALALDPTDIPGDELHAYLGDAIGARLYLADYMLKTDARGGLAPEGFEYSPQALGYVAEFLLALHTAGEADPAKWGAQVSSLAENSFWAETIPAFLHSLSPATTTYPGDLSYLGEVFLPAWYGDGQKYWAPDMIGLYGPMGVYDQLIGDSQQLETLRWIETHTPAGGEPQLIPGRIAQAETFGIAIQYFLLFDPSVPAPSDPRPVLSSDYYAPGIGRWMIRTSWTPEAAWFDYSLGWNSIDHQQRDGNSFEFYRNGEWLIERRVGYGFDYAASDNLNTLAIQNDKPDRSPDDYRTLMWERGSQFPYNDARPLILARSNQQNYAYVMGDATQLYNNSYEGLSAVTQAIRSILWLKGGHGENDVLVVYDRAATRRPGQFKRFWLSLPARMKVQGGNGVMVTDQGQQLFLETLLPLDARLDVNPAEDEPSGRPAQGDAVKFRLRVEASRPSEEVQFLTVLQGADAGARPLPVSRIESPAGAAFDGALIGTNAVLFPRQASTSFGELRYELPVGVEWQLITGLPPDAAVDVLLESVGNSISVMIRPGSTYQVDSQGVLSLESSQ